MKLSLCVTTYNRYEMTIESFAQVLNDPRIDDIVIMDDCSTDGSGENLQSHFTNYPKVSVLQQPKNVGMSRNKRDAIARAKNEWCIIFDSDNVIGLDYLDAFFEYVPDADKEDCQLITKKQDYENIIFCPAFAKPKFNYTRYAYFDRMFGAKECARAIIYDDFNLLMNTCNCIVNRDYYLATYKYNPEHKASDTIWHNYNHLKSGGVFAVVPNMQYFHRVHPGSGFMQNADYNIKQAEKVRKLIQQL